MPTKEAICIFILILTIKRVRKVGQVPLLQLVKKKSRQINEIRSGGRFTRNKFL